MQTEMADCKSRFVRYEKKRPGSTWVLVLQGLQGVHPKRIVTETGATVAIPNGYKRVPVRSSFKDLMCPPRVDPAALDRAAVHIDAWLRASEKHWLTVDAYRRHLRANLGRKRRRALKVLLLDRNFADVAFEANAMGKAYSPARFFRKNVAYITPSETHDGDDDVVRAFTLRHSSYGTTKDMEFHVRHRSTWHPLRDGCRFSKDTPIGWRGPMIPWEDAKKLPPVYFGENPFTRRSAAPPPPSRRRAPR